MKEELIFLDEFGINLTMTRTHARAPLGKRAYVTQPLHHGSNISVISALGVQGICAPMMIEGAINTEVFELYTCGTCSSPACARGTACCSTTSSFTLPPRPSN